MESPQRAIELDDSTSVVNGAVHLPSSGCALGATADGMVSYITTGRGAERCGYDQCGQKRALVLTPGLTLWSVGSVARGSEAGMRPRSSHLS